jgi:peptidoglycan/LPS O-acetylase OafA/YrhL
MGLIRLLLAISVVAAHSGGIFGSTLVGGKIAVQSFYMISGFYMSLILNEKYIGVNRSYRLFITNRLIRLYPIYWVVLLGTILVSLSIALFSKGQLMPVFENYLSVKTNLLSFGYLILTNLFIFGQDVVLFLGINPESGNLFFTTNCWDTNPVLYSFLFIPQAWTLGLELTFYVIAPFILRRGLKIIVLLMILSFALRLVIYNYLNLQTDPWTYMFFPAEIVFFLSGYLSYRIYLNWKDKTIPPRLVSVILAFTVAFTISYFYLPSIKISWFPFSIKELMYFTTIVLSIPLLFIFFKKSKIDNQIGDLSYPVYISHMLVIMVLGANSFPITFLKSGWAVCLVTIIVAYILNKIVAAPIEEYRQSRLKNQVSG